MKTSTVKHSFAHSEFIKPQYTNDCIKNHTNIMWRDKLDVVEYETNLNPLPNDKRFNYLKEENGII